MGMEMPSWYDIYHLDDNPNRPRENLDDVQQSVQYLQSIIQNETGMLKLQVPKADIWQLVENYQPLLWIAQFHKFSESFQLGVLF